MKEGKSKHNGQRTKRRRSRPKVAGVNLTNRSRITNNNGLLEFVDGRSVFARRFRDLIQAYTEDQGGESNLGEGRRILIRRCACLVVESERLESRFARNEGASPVALDRYLRVVNALRRLTSTIGLDRKMRTIDHTDLVVSEIEGGQYEPDGADR